MRYVGYCYDSGAWSGDLTAVLIREEPDGWYNVASHISSNQNWGEIDVARHYEKRRDPRPGDTFEWIGLITDKDQLAAYPPAPAREPVDV